MTWTDVARGQDGVVARFQLHDAGLTERQVELMISRGDFQRIHPGVFLHSSLRPSHRQRLWAAALWSGGVISHRSAAPLWGVEIADSDQIHVTTPDLRFRRSAKSVAVHRVALRPDEISSRAGLPVTCRARTIIDLLRTERFDSALTLLDCSLQLSWLQPGEVRHSVIAQPRRPGNVQLKRLLAKIEPGAQAESERVLHRLLRQAGIGGWRPQLRVRLPNRVAIVDVGFPEFKIAIEVDGRRYHDAFSERFEDDRARQNELVAAGWVVLRFTWRRLEDDPAGVIAESGVACNVTHAWGRRCCTRCAVRPLS